MEDSHSSDVIMFVKNEKTKHFNLIENILNHINHFSSEVSKETSRNKVMKLENENCQEKIKSLSSEKHNREEIIEKLKNELIMLNTSLEEKNVQKLRIRKKKNKLETSCLRCKRDCEPTESDQQVLLITLKKYQMCKKITGIHWDFGAPENISKGYITNKQKKNYVKSFEFKKISKNMVLEDCLFNEISLAAKDDWSDIIETADILEVNKDGV